MSTVTDAMIEQVEKEFDGVVLDIINKHEELTVVVKKNDIIQVLTSLKENYHFDQLVDLCGVDYSTFGHSEWKTETASSTGFSRGSGDTDISTQGLYNCRFAVVYHLQSIRMNARIRVKAMVSEDDLIVPTSIDLWPSAEWNEREAFDLFGILFDGHPDLRRILTDYGFVGHPFRKDFPISGHVEMRYDDNLKRVIYGPVEIEPRVNVARVIREDNRYADDNISEGK